MFNWLKRLFEKEDPMFEPGMIYFPPIKETYQKIPEIGEIYQLENEKGFYVFIDSVDLEKNHINFYMCDKKGFIYSIPKQTYSIDFFLKVYKQFRKAKAMDENIKVTATGNIDIGCVYEEISSGKLFCISGIRYNSHIDHKVVEITLIHSKYTRDLEHRILEKTILFEDFKKEYRKHNPSQERKEMEEFTGIFTGKNYYEVSDFQDHCYYKRRSNYCIYRKNHIDNSIEIYANNSWVKAQDKYNDLTIAYFDAVVRTDEIKPPRTLKLEDLNKAWIKKDNSFTIYKIVGVDKNQSVFVCSRDHGVVTIANIELFFIEFREATQTDIDNLTKGN